MVTRLAEQKGLDLFLETCETLFSQNIQFVLLGDGDRVYQTAFRNIAARHPKKVSVTIKFDIAEAHRIYAGADLFLMPSYFEPCGLGQMISLCYGTVPLVHRTGGLADTITQFDPYRPSGNGFVFWQYNKEGFIRCFEHALKAYKHPDQFKALVKRAFESRFTWDNSALEYQKIYNEK